MIPAVSSVGNVGPGKTTLLEEVVREFKWLGYRGQKVLWEDN